MPDLLPIGTEFDNQKIGLRLRVVAHVRNQYGRMAEQVVPAGATVKKTLRQTRQNAVVAAGFASRVEKASRSHPRHRPRRVRRNSRVREARIESGGNPWPAIVWLAIILASLVAIGQFHRKMPDLPKLPTYSHSKR